MMGDDGVGHEVVRRLEQCELPDGVRFVAVDGDVLALTNLWQGETEVWLVDAVSSNQPAGSLLVFEHQDLLGISGGGLSTHHPTVGEFLRWILHARPDMAVIKFHLFGIEAGVVRTERGLSREVEVATCRLVGEMGRAARQFQPAAL
jgi:hydrogenase maturation protease